jgi:hypothetical protein
VREHKLLVGILPEAVNQGLTATQVAILHAELLEEGV